MNRKNRYPFLLSALLLLGVLLSAATFVGPAWNCPRRSLFIKLDADGKDITDTGEVERAKTKVEALLFDIFVIFNPQIYQFHIFLSIYLLQIPKANRYSPHPKL